MLYFILGIIVGILLANISFITNEKQKEIRNVISNKVIKNDAVIIENNNILEELIPDNYEYTTNRK